MLNCDDKKVFLMISSWLTGFSDVELLGTGLLETYWEVVQRESSAENLQYFLAASRDIFAEGEGSEIKTNQLILQRLIPPSCYDNLAQNIVYMWYAGAWYPTVSTATDLAQVRNLSPNVLMRVRFYPGWVIYAPQQILGRYSKILKRLEKIFWISWIA